MEGLVDPPTRQGEPGAVAEGGAGGRYPSDPAIFAETIRRRGPGVVRVGL